MRKQQLENLKIGDKVQKFGSDIIYTVTDRPGLETNRNNFIMDAVIKTIDHSTGQIKTRSIVTAMAPNSVLKNCKLVEEIEEVAVTEEIPDMVGYLSQGMIEEQGEIVPDTTIGLDKIKNPETKAKAIEGAKSAIKKMKDKKKAKKVTDDTVITVTQMAAELGMTAPDARRILRKAKIEKPEGGWTVKKGSDKFLEIQSALQNTQEKRAERMGK